MDSRTRPGISEIRKSANNLERAHGGAVCCRTRPWWHCYNSLSARLQIKRLNTPGDANEINHTHYHKEKQEEKKHRGHICSLKCLTLLNINQLPHTNWCMKVNVLVCTKHSDEYSRGSHLASSHIPERNSFAQTQTVPPIIRALISAVNLFCFFFPWRY